MSSRTNYASRPRLHSSARLTRPTIVVMNMGPVRQQNTEFSRKQNGMLEIPTISEIADNHNLASEAAFVRVRSGVL